jgi:hypothetical protein
MRGFSPAARRRCPPGPGPADLVLGDGAAYTMAVPAPRAEAVAVRDGRMPDWRPAVRSGVPAMGWRGERRRLTVECRP